MPLAHGVCRGSIANQHRMQRWTEIALDEHRRIRIGCEKIAEWAEDRALAELCAILQQASGGRCHADAIAFESFQPVDLALEADMRLVRLEERRARSRIGVTRFTLANARPLGSFDDLGGGGDRVVACDEGLRQLATRDRGCVEQVRALALELLTAAFHFVQLALGTRACEV